MTPTATVASASIALLPVRGIAGGAFTARGRVAAGATGVRILWDDGTAVRGLKEGAVSADGKYSLTLVIPEDAQPGDVQVCAIASGTDTLGLDAGCTVFTVLPTPPAAITGVVTDQGGAALPGVEVRLMTDAGAPVARATTASDGTYSFTDLAPGDYLVDARCPTSGAPSCAPSRDYFPPEAVHLTPGAAAPQPLTSVPPPLDAVALSGFGGIALPGGTLSADAPVRVTNGLSGVVARLGSLQGLGLDPLTVRFWADVDFFDDRARTKAVLFQMLQGSDVLASKTTSTRQPVSASDPAYVFTSYVADFNVNDLPPGELTLRVTPLLGGVAVTPHDYTIRMTDLVSRWFNDAITNPAVTITADGADDLVYGFTGTLPNPAFSFDQPITLPFGTTLDNQVVLGIPIEEQLHTNATWSGSAKASAQVTFLSQNFLNDTRSYNGPTGASFAETAYQLDTIHKDLFGKQCVPIPPLSFSQAFSIAPCSSCPSLSSGIGFTTHECVQTFVDFDSTIGNDLHVNARMSTGAAVPAPLELKVDAVVCGGSAQTAPGATVSLPVYYDPARSPLFGFDDPCLKIGAQLNYTASCVGIAVTTGTGALSELRYGCSTSLLSPTGQTLTQAPLTVAELSPSPSVATDGAGHALAVWIQEESSDPTHPDRHVVSSYYNGTTWTAATNVTTQRALVDTPKVTFLGPSRALAVWVQSTLSLDQALASDTPTLLGSTELAFSLWDGSTWTAPAPITSDALLDTAPSLAGDPASGHAVLMWLRAHDSPLAGQSPVGVYAALFDGVQWNAPTLVGVRSAMLERAPTVKFDRQGQAVAMWLRDVDGNVLTSEDRQIVVSRDEQGVWSTPEAIPNLPPGAYTPSFAFDTFNNPVVVFVVPPVEVETGQLGSGDGNASVLYVAHRRDSTWEVGPIGTNIHAERPVVSVTSDNHAIVMYRQFGDNGDVHVSGDLASAVAALGDSPPSWTTGFLTADGQVNWEVAFDIDAATDTSFVFDVKKPSAATASLSAAGTVGGRAAANTVANGETVVSHMVIPYQPDLALAPADITFSNPHPLVGDTITITANIHNLGLRSVGDVTLVRLPNGSRRADSTRSGAFTVAFYDDDELIGRFDVLASSLPFNSMSLVPMRYTIARGGVHTITVVVDEAGDVTESDETNNVAATSLGRPPAPTDVTTTVDAERSRLTIRWQAPDTGGIQGYRVYRSTTAGTGYELVGGTTAATEFVDALAVRGVTYHYVVAAVDVYGAASTFSNEVTASIAAPACVGDCGRDGAVTVNELLVGVNIALGNLPIDRCTAFDANADGAVTIDELLAAVNNALGTCPAG